MRVLGSLKVWSNRSPVSPRQENPRAPGVRSVNDKEGGRSGPSGAIRPCGGGRHTSDERAPVTDGGRSATVATRVRLCVCPVVSLDPGPDLDVGSGVGPNGSSPDREGGVGGIPVDVVRSSELGSSPCLRVRSLRPSSTSLREVVIHPFLVCQRFVGGLWSVTRSMK